MKIRWLNRWGWWFSLNLCLLMQVGAAADLEPADPPLVSYRHETVAIGNRVHIKPGERCEQLVVIFGQALVEGEIEGDLVVVNSTVEVSGPIRGNLVSVLSTGRLSVPAEVKGDVVSILSSLRLEDGVRVQGQKTEINLDLPTKFFTGLKNWVGQGLLLARPLPPQFLWVWLVVGTLFLIYALVSVLFPRAIQGCVEALDQNGIAAFFTGLLVLLLLGPLVFLLVVSIAGILVVPFLFCGLFILGLFGKVALLQYTGLQLGRQTGFKLMQLPLVALVTGMVLYCLIYMVPVLGFLVWGLVVPFCLGAGVVAITKSFKPPAPNTPLTDVPLTSPGSSQLASAETSAVGLPLNLLLLPRAGFWIRIWANLIDAILILVVVKLLHTVNYLLLAWLIYHTVMWTWRGTTIGGAICHLKMLRLDGQPVGFAVALMRGLAAFISALALGLGFLWAAWDKERQSWHDKIAGTILVKTPSGLPLI